jgi:branched-subunit amino acid aminotransferase/4-amino-4-deoxychorismate lyase
MSEQWKVYVNGEMVPWDEARISVFDRGFQYGDGVFEGMRCYDGRIFKLKEHTDRLFRSARAVHIEVPISKDEFNQAVKGVIHHPRHRPQAGTRSPQHDHSQYRHTGPSDR